MLSAADKQRYQLRKTMVAHWYSICQHRSSLWNGVWYAHPFDTIHTDSSDTFCCLFAEPLLVGIKTAC